ncbi:MAG: sigma-70 family RNA polymerase sigma factor [Ruminococcus sp.]|nr:sigma-70 family RNA polymerase sigma factor [Ruminococcus sp.]
MTHKEYLSLAEKSPPEAHRALLSEYGKYVYTIVFSRLRSCAAPEDIEECVGDVFIELALNIAGSDFYSGDLKNAVGTLAKCRAINYYNRLSTRNSRRSDLGDDVPAEADIAENAEKKEMQRILLRSVSELGKPDSDILLLRYYYGLTAADIAKRLGLKPRNVQKRAERALARLREILEKAGIRRDDL